MDISIDSNIFRNSTLLKLLNEHPHSIYISSIVELEQSFYYRMKGRIELWNTIHQRLNLLVIPVTKIESRIAAEFAQYFNDRPGSPADRFRDCLIAACSRRIGVPIVTDNISDFEYLDSEQIISSDQMIDHIRAMKDER